MFGSATNSFDALGGFSFLKVVLPGSFMRSAFPVSAWFLVVLLSLAPISRAQDNSDGKKDGGKKHYLTFQVSYFGSAHRSHQDENGQSETSIEVNDRFSGRIEVRPTEAYDLPTKQSEAAQLARLKAMQAAVLAGDTEKLKAVTPPLLVTWFPRGNEVEITGTISETMRSSSYNTEFGESRAQSDRATESYRSQKVFKGDFGNAFVKIRAGEKLYDIQFSLMPDMATTWEAVHQTLVSDHKEEGHDRHTESEAAVPLDAGPNQIGLGYSNDQIVAEVKGQPLAGAAGELLGTTRIPVPKPAGWDGSWDIAMLVSWQIDLTLPPVELVITAPGYDEWRPEGNIKKPAEPGNKLVARATLKPKAGQGTFVPRVKSIRFQLLDTSREPGVCLNWPLEAKDDDYDLRLAAVAGGKLSKKDQILEVDDPRRNDEGQAYAEVQINSYDFGGRASLRAICLLADGREIEGVMKDAGETPRLPKMKSPGWIADSWRKAHHAEKLADDDDNEKVEGQKDNGDGYTLYEEYRGWVVNGERVEGDPEKKDFFVLNLIGGDAEPGIDLFEQLSELRVHSKLLPEEMSETTRLMNGNRRDGPHNKDQHGVWVKTFTRSALGDNGADTPMTKSGVAGRPGITKGVGILARDNTESIFNKPFNLPAQDTVFAFDRAIAHELLHSVGVEHHGEKGDYDIGLRLISPLHPWNRLGRPYFEGLGKETVIVLDETGQDIAAKHYQELSAMEQFLRMGLMDSYLKDARNFFAGRPGYESLKQWGTPEVKAEVDLEDAFSLLAPLLGLVGVEQGAHSGDQDCVMRYYFAKYYEAKGRPEKTLYLVTPGTEHIGMEICHSGTGTGINAAGHKPQSRYGNAAGDAGNCFEQICPNDAIPPRKVK